MNQAQAKKLYKKKKALFAIFQDAYQVFRPAKDAWYKARDVSEIYKGKAIHFEGKHDVAIGAHGFGNRLGKAVKEYVAFGTVFWRDQ